MMRRLLFWLFLIQVTVLTITYAVTAPVNCATALKTVFGNEGDYQCLRGDSGNWTGGKVGKGALKGTKFGIAAASYPKVDIKNLTLATAALYYERDYWNVLHLGDIKSQWLATMFLDTAVNCGTGTAAILIARTINVLNGKSEDFPVDPVLGPAEIAWINDYTQTRWYDLGKDKDTSRRALFGMVFREMRVRRYLDIVDRNPKMLKWLPIWVRRS
jgi:lysozyme family protein